MSVALTNNFAMAPQEQLRVVKRVQRVVLGVSSSTPTPALLRFSDVGLLYFLNQKQSQLHMAVSACDFASNPKLKALASLVEFVRFIVAGLIVEAERIDESVIQVKKETADLAEALRKYDLDLQFQKEKLGTAVEQAISQHYRTRLNVPSRRHGAHMDVITRHEEGELKDLPQHIQMLRRRLRVLKTQVKGLAIIQRMLHGNGLELPEAEVNAIVSELDILATFRKAVHRTRDVMMDVMERDALQAPQSLVEFMTYLDSGLTAATDDLKSAEMELKKDAVATTRNDERTRLEALNMRNKHNSAEALRMNDLIAFEVNHHATSASMPREPSRSQQQLYRQASSSVDAAAAAAPNRYLPPATAAQPLPHFQQQRHQQPDLSLHHQPPPSRSTSAQHAPQQQPEQHHFQQQHRLQYQQQQAFTQHYQQQHQHAHYHQPARHEEQQVRPASRSTSQPFDDLESFLEHHCA